MTEPLENIRRDALKLFLRPLVRFCLRGTHTIQDFYNLTKEVFVEVASEEILRSNEKVNVSRLSVITGLHRLEVRRIYKENEPALEKESDNLIRNLMNRWEHDNRFVTERKKPKVLDYKGDDSEFAQLVRLINSTINPSTVLWQMERIEAVEKTARGVKLIKQSPLFKKNPRKGFELLFKGLDKMMLSVEENVLDPQDPRNLHLHTEFDNISRAKLKEIRAWLLKEGQMFHKRAREYLSKHDLDVNPELNDTGGVKIVLTSFSFSEEGAEELEARRTA